VFEFDLTFLALVEVHKLREGPPYVLVNYFKVLPLTTILLIFVAKSFVKELFVIWIFIGYTPLFNRCKISPVSPESSSLHSGCESPSLNDDGFHPSSEFLVHPQRSPTFTALIILTRQIPPVVSAQGHKLKYVADVQQF